MGGLPRIVWDGLVYGDTQIQGVVMGRHPRIVQDSLGIYLRCTGILRHRGW